MIQVKQIPLTDEQKQKVVSYFCSEIDDALSARSDMEKQWKLAVRQYNGRLERQGAGKRRANIDIPLTREYSQQSKARLINPLFQQETLFVAIPRKPDAEEFAREVEEVLDFISDKGNILGVCNDWVKTAHIYHYAPVKAAWTDTKRVIKEWQKVMQPVVGPDGQPATEIVAGPDGMPVIQPVMEEKMVEVEREVQDKLGCYPRVLNPGDLIMPTDTFDVDSARWVDHRFYLNKVELKARLRQKDYEGDIQRIEVQIADRPDFAVEQKRLLGIDISKQKLAEHHEIYTTVGEMKEALTETTGEDLTSLGDDRTEIILTIDKTNSQFRRGIYNFFHSYPRPFVLWSYEQSEDSPFGVSLAYIMEPIHKAYSAMICQELDAQSAANKTLLAVKAGSDVGKQFKDGEVPEGVVEINGDPRTDITQFNLSQPRTTSPQMRSELQMHAERVSAVAAINFGQDPTGRPTATGQTLQSTESQQPLYDKMESFRSSVAKLGLMCLSRYKQFFPEGLQYYLKTETPDGMTILPGVMYWPDEDITEQVYIETRVSSSTMNKNMRRQEKLAMADKIPQIYMTLSQMMSQAVMPSPMSAIMLKLVRGYQLIIDDWLTEFEISNKDDINPDLSQEVQIGAMVQALMAQNQQLMSMLGMAPPGGPGAPGPGPQGPGGPGAVSGPPPGGPGQRGTPQMGPPQQGPPPPGPNGQRPPGPG